MKTTQIVLALTVAVVTACSSDDGPTTTTVAVTTEVQAAMTAAIQDEYHAEETYLRVLADFGNTLPFYNVVYAEQRHSASLAALFERRGLPVPVSIWHLNNVPRFASVAAACAGAAGAEVANIALYDNALALTLPTDVRNVLTNNRRASLEKHLPAFEVCR
ncbi:MAG: DUF2202 domain-containing protein [Gemmatimonadetes bacterium]|nr:DUF2202 domain-containing protein [Gemmatimonadota bacterium]MCC6771230.1 DUF2202 domain-containing protein [Gemmatimonadaceae bacterium]